MCVCVCVLMLICMRVCIGVYICACVSTCENIATHNQISLFPLLPSQKCTFCKCPTNPYIYTYIR